jgi:hypothetical protein
MKTAMQELIEYLRSLAFSKCHLGMGDIMLTQGHIDELEEKYIEKEKEQIIDAYENGYEACDMDEAMEVNKKLTSGDLYYNMNYNQNKEIVTPQRGWTINLPK